MLDLLRGIAALAVLLYHSGMFLGFNVLPNAYLAVDMFFMLSGFVIAHNYDAKIARGMTIKEFMLHRYIRLYPCYGLAFFLGLVLGGARLIRNAGYVDGVGLFGAALPNLFMLPSVTSIYGEYGMYPFNGSSWSLLYELIANVLYWLSHRFLTGSRLIVVLIASAVGFIFAARHVGTVDLGMRTSDAILGLPRVTFTFFIGLAIRRYLHGALRVQLRHLGIAMAVLTLIGTFCVSDLLGVSHRLVGELTAILVVYPILLLAVSNTTVGTKLSPICRFAGDTSYPVYIMQTPMFFLVAAIPQIFFHKTALDWVPTIGIVEVLFIVIFAWYVDRYYDLPLRRVLKTHLLASKPLAIRAS
jgi:peptidoglycan/LPS O-acetylase OafA/YrhL